MEFDFEKAGKEAAQSRRGLQGTESPEQIAAIDRAIADLLNRQRLTKIAINGAFLGLRNTEGIIVALQFITRFTAKLYKAKKLTIDQLPDS